MKLEDRIQNIKKILRLCDSSEITLVDEECGEFFNTFLSSPRFSRHPVFNPTYIEIGLYLDSCAINPTMFIEYEYSWDRDGGETEMLLFNDPGSKYKYGGNWGNNSEADSMYHGAIDYSDIPEKIWKRIELYAYERAKKDVGKASEVLIEALEESDRKENELKNIKIEK